MKMNKKILAGNLKYKEKIKIIKFLKIRDFPANMHHVNLSLFIAQIFRELVQLKI
jgi:hypothetical protein